MSNITESHLSIENLNHAYGDLRVLQDVSFNLVKGEILGILGPNGSGKTTVLSFLSGLLKADSGALLMDGSALSPTSPAWRSQLGVVFQQPSLDPLLSVEENLNLVCRLHGYRGEAVQKRVGEALTQADLSDRAESIVKTLSGGMKRRIDLARGVIHRPAVLLLDEPTAGLDEPSYRRTWSFLEQIRREEGVTIILATHRVDEADRCDRLLIMNRGKIAKSATPDALRQLLSEDVVELSGPDLSLLAERVKDGFQMETIVEGKNLLIECDSGHQLIPRLVDYLGTEALTSVALRRASLADAFIKVTGYSLDGEKEGAGSDGDRS